MTPFDAAKILSISGEMNSEAVKAAYRAACKKYHPDINPAGEEMMKAINEAFDTLKDYSGSIDPQKTENSADYPEELNEALNKIVGLAGLVIEICGAWVWVSGETKDHKDTLKAAGFKWANKKKMWYFRPADWKASRNRKEHSIDEIRQKYGTSRPGYRSQAQLSAAV